MYFPSNITDDSNYFLTQNYLSSLSADYLESIILARKQLQIQNNPTQSLLDEGGTYRIPCLQKIPDESEYLNKNNTLTKLQNAIVSSLQEGISSIVYPETSLQTNSNLAQNELDETERLSKRRESAPACLDEANAHVSYEQKGFSDFSIRNLLKIRQERRRSMDCKLLMDDKILNEKNKNMRRQRTIYDPTQTNTLELAFGRQKYMVGTERELLAERLGLTEAQVRIWFQNRRSKWRKQMRAESYSIDF